MQLHQISEVIDSILAGNNITEKMIDEYLDDHEITKKRLMNITKICKKNKYFIGDNQ